MGIGSTDTERIDRCASRERFGDLSAFAEDFDRLPVLGFGLDFEGKLIKMDLGVGAVRGDARKESFVMELQCSFDHPDEPCTGFEMSDVGFDRADPGMGLALEILVPEGFIAVSQLQATDFDGVSQLRPGSMGFDVANGSRIDASI
jgi:hypothetical protein